MSPGPTQLEWTWLLRMTRLAFMVISNQSKRSCTQNIGILELINIRDKSACLGVQTNDLNSVYSPA